MQIQQYWKDIDIKRIEKLSKGNYEAMIRRTPDIDNFRKNPLRIHLAGGMLWLSVYDAMKGKMSQEEFGEMINAAIEAPMLKRNFQKQKAFDIKVQKKENRKKQDCKFSF